MSSSIPTAKAYLVGTVLPTLFPAPILVSYGMPGTFEADDYVSVGGVQVDHEVPVMGSARRFEEVARLSVLLSSWRGGDQPQEASAVPVYLLPYMVQSLLNPHRSAGW